MSVRAGTLSRQAARPTLLLAAIAALALTLVAIIGPAFASDVDPILLDGKPNCDDLGYDHEVRVHPGASGEYDDGTLFVSVLVRETDNGPTFDWSASFAIPLVIAKDGPNGANGYYYNPAASDDDGLHSPARPGGEWAPLAGIRFCYNEGPDGSGSPSESASESPSETPVETPNETPVETPNETPVETPNETPVETPNETPVETPNETPNETPVETPNETPNETPDGTPEQSVQGGTGTPEPSLPDGAMGAQHGPSPLPTIAFSLILLASLATLAYANVRSARQRA